MSFQLTHSIRGRLAATLFTAFIVLLSLASVLIFFVARNILQHDFDARLFAKAQAALASISQNGTGLDIDWTELPHELNSKKNAQEAIQVIDGAGHAAFANSLLPTPSGTASVKGTYQNQVLPGLGHVRVLTLSFLPHIEEEDMAATPASLRKPCVLALAVNREPLDYSLRKLTLVLVLMTGITSLLALALVWLILKAGLKPLDQLCAQVGKVKVESLGQQIPSHDLPEELAPVAAKLNDLLSRLEVSFARERRFSADVSHELRTPVAELKTLSEVMLLEKAHSPDVRQAFEEARDIACQMETMVTVLLEMVRQEEGRTPLVLTEVDLEAQVQRTWKKYEAKAALREIHLKMTSPDLKPVFRSEPRLLGMVLANLLENAIDYSPAGSAVEIEFRPNSEFPCLVISNLTTALVPADLPHLFERFWRKDSARSGTNHFGIGLALSRTLCQRIGIHITASMEKGTLLRFWLQFSPAPVTPSLR